MNQLTINVHIDDVSDTSSIAKIIRTLSLLGQQQELILGQAVSTESTGCTGCASQAPVAIVHGTVEAIVPAVPATPVVPAAPVAQAEPAAPVVPTAPVAPAAPVTQTAPAQETSKSDLDSKGLPWDARIHSDTRNKNADGSWRLRRNVDKDLVASVTAELKGGAAPLAQSQPAVPPAPVPTVPTAPQTPVPTVPTAPAAAAPSAPVPTAQSTVAPAASAVPQAPAAPAAPMAPSGDLKTALSPFTRIVVAAAKQQVAVPDIVARAAEFGIVINLPADLREADASLVEAIALSFGI